jgi:hypothetical protein
MRIVWVVVLFALAGIAPAFAQAPAAEVLFVGELRSITLTPRDWADERRALEADEAIVVSNSCGTASTTFSVIRSTHRLPRDVRTTGRLGEWCDPPVALTHERVLVVMTRHGRELVQSYEIVEQQGAAYALFLDPAELLNRHSPEVQRLMSLHPLPEPIEYDARGVTDDGLAEWVSHRPALELRDGQVWIVRGIPLTQVFPDYSND